MTHIIHAGGVVIAELDLEALYQRGKASADRVKLSPCPACGCVPEIRKDSGAWYLVGNFNCDACRGTYALPDEEELADLLRNNK